MYSFNESFKVNFVKSDAVLIDKESLTNMLFLSVL